jgi:D-glycero-alpha-D-manno-heptose 1-phosphate guanylyltransferase
MDNQIKALILAGGFGTRLQSVVKDVPKPMAQIGNRVFLEYVLDFLIKNNIKEVYVSVGFKKDIIMKYFKDTYKNLKIHYITEDKPLKTGGAIKKALNIIKGDKIFVLNGDTLFDIELKKLFLEADVVMALKKMKNFDRYGSVIMDQNNKIVKFCEKKPLKSGNINGGIYLIKHNIFDKIEVGESFSFEEFLQNNNIDIKGVLFDKYFIDIGIPQDYQKAKIKLQKQKGEI